MKKKIVLIGGIAGSGKSTIGDYISQGYPYVYVDKDNVTSILMESLLENINQNKNDRESKDYIERVRPFEYEQFIEIIMHISKHNYIIGAAPFLKEFQDLKWMINFKKQVNKQNDDLIIIWVNTNPYDTKSRLIKRDERRDDYKLSIFEEYAKEINKINTYIIENLKKLQKSKEIKTYIVDNFNGTLEDTFDKIDTIIYNINDL